METQNKLVGGLTTETKQRAKDYDRHVAMSELNRLTKLRRNQRIWKVVKEFGKYMLPYFVVGVLMVLMANHLFLGV